MEDEIALKQEPSRTREIARRIVRHENFVLSVILATLITIIAVVTKGKSVSTSNVMNVVVQSSMRGVASVGQAFVILTGGIDLSVGGIALFAACLGATLMSGTTGFPVGALAVMILVAISVGAGNGASVSRLGMAPLIVTLAVWQIARGVAYIFNKGFTITDLPPSMAFLGSGEIAEVPVPIIIFVGVCVAAYFVLYHTTFGRSVYAVGGNPASAWLSGIKVPNILFSAYAIGGFLAGIAGIITISRIMCVSMTVMDGLMLDSIAAVVIGGVSLAGGRGTLIGVILGVMILGVINNGMNLMHVGPAYQIVIRGVIIFAAVAVNTLRRR